MLVLKQCLKLTPAVYWRGTDPSNESRRKVPSGRALLLLDLHARVLSTDNLDQILPNKEACLRVQTEFTSCIFVYFGIRFGGPRFLVGDNIFACYKVSDGYEFASFRILR